MLSRITGWILFLQASYLASYVILAVLNLITHRAVFRAFTSLRAVLGLDNKFVRLSDYIFYPMVFSAVFNLAVMIAFFWAILRRQHVPSLASDFFSILNAFYLAASGWILFMAFTNIVGK